MSRAFIAGLPFRKQGVVHAFRCDHFTARRSLHRTVIFKNQGFAHAH